MQYLSQSKRQGSSEGQRYVMERFVAICPNDRAMLQQIFYVENPVWQQKFHNADDR